MTDVDAGGRDRLALAVLTQYRMATTEQMHLILSPDVRTEQTRRRLMKLRAEGLIDRITLPQAGRLRVWHPTQYGAQVASEWPELRGRRPPKTATDPTAVRLAVGHALTVTKTGLQFLQDASRWTGSPRSTTPSAPARPSSLTPSSTTAAAPQTAAPAGR
ncbi:replication-relaxation family protein [Streptomyces sp. NPDC004059]